MDDENQSLLINRIESRIIQLEVAIVTLDDIDELVLATERAHLEAIKRSLIERLENLKRMSGKGAA